MYTPDHLRKVAWSVCYPYYVDARISHGSHKWDKSHAWKWVKMQCAVHDPSISLRCLILFIKRYLFLDTNFYSEQDVFSQLVYIGTRVRCVNLKSHPDTCAVMLLADWTCHLITTGCRSCVDAFPFCSFSFFFSCSECVQLDKSYTVLLLQDWMPSLMILAFCNSQNLWQVYVAGLSLIDVESRYLKCWPLPPVYHRSFAFVLNNQVYKICQSHQSYQMSKSMQTIETP